MKKALVIIGVALIIFSTISIVDVTEGQSGAGLYGMLTFYLIMLIISGTLIYFGTKESKDKNNYKTQLNTPKSDKYQSNFQTLKDLHEQGLLTDDEYYQKSAKQKTEKLQTELNLKNDQLTSTTMQLIKNKEFIQGIQAKIITSIDKGGSVQELKRIISSIDKELSDEDYWAKFAYHFDQVHGNYLEKLSSMDIKLSPREIKLAAFLRMNMSSKEIAKLLNITTRGVELARYRLRKKLKLEREQNLVEYLIELDKNNTIS